MRMNTKPLWRGTLTLLVGSGAAQLAPLLFGPFLARMYSPETFGVFHLASAIGGNIAVVACARYEFALPLAQSDAEAAALRGLCVRVLLAVSATSLAASVAAALWWGAAWPLAVPLMVVSLGGLSLLTLEATRLQRFTVLAGARITQFWGCGALQLAMGTLHAGLWGLLLGPIVAAMSAAWRLQRASSSATGTVTVQGQVYGPAGRAPESEHMNCAAATTDWKKVARLHRDFPFLNTPHAFLGALQDTLSIALIAACAGPAAAGVWGLTLRYLKAPATLAGGAVSQVLYPTLGAQEGPSIASREQVRQVMRVLMASGLALGGAVYALSDWVLPTLLGPGWEAAGPLGQALAVYVGLHFVASPLGVVTLAWRAQAWALNVIVIGQAMFLAALASALMWPPAGADPLEQAATAISVAMAMYFSWYFYKLWNWPVPRAAEC